MGPTVTCGITVSDIPGGVVRDVVSPSPVPAQGGLSSKRRSVGLNYAPVVVGMTGIGPVKSIRRLCAIRHMNEKLYYRTSLYFWDWTDCVLEFKPEGGIFRGKWEWRVQGATCNAACYSRREKDYR